MIINSNYKDIPLYESDIFSYLFSRKDRPFPDSKLLLQDADEPSRQYTWRTLREAAIRFGRGLQQNLKLEKSQVVTMMAANDVDLPGMIFGVLACGGIMSTVNPAYTATETEHQLRDSNSRILIADMATLPLARTVAAKINVPSSHILLTGRSRDPEGQIRHWTDILSDDVSGEGPFVPIDAKNDVAFLVYSSGTTGKPKGVMLTHHNVTANNDQVQLFETTTWDGSRSIPGFRDAVPGVGDKILACLPFFHIYGLTAMMISPIFNGVCTIVTPGFDIEKWCRLVQDHKITIGYVVPPIVVQLAKDPIVDKYDMSSLRVTTSGAAPCSKDLIDAVFKRIGMRIKQGYGMTEASPTVFTMRWADWNRKSGSAGLLVPNMKAKFCSVREADDARPAKELARGEVGELYIQGPNVFKGYFNNKEATANSFEGPWFKTGDVGFVDEDGDLFITDRVKELIKYKGFQVAPAELEGMLLESDLVQDAGVVGVNRPELGTEVPRAYVVRAGGKKAVQPGDDQKIIKWLDSKLVSYKRLRGGVVFVDEIPKSGSGKILRRILKEQANKEPKARL